LTATARCRPAAAGFTLDVMPDRTDNLVALFRTHAATAGAVVSISLMAAGAGWPQASSPPPSTRVQTLGDQTPGIQTPAPQAVPGRPAPAQDEPSPSPPPPAREENPGLINEMGKLFEKSLSILPTLKSPQQTMENLNSGTKDAGESLSRLAKPSSMVAGRMACPVSTNGAPDCKAGADKLCRTKGYKEGKSLNTDSAQTCSPKVFIPGRTRKPDDCRTDNYVTSALCQ
jgi:hypothetical protein